MSKSYRLLPAIGPENEHFWKSGADGKLCFLRCTACAYYIHPPSPVCPACLCRELSPEPVSGGGVVHTYTVNHQPWIPGFEPPYVVAIVELDEQPGLRLTTNIVGCTPDEVRIGMRVQVSFEDLGEDIHLPLFEPARGDAK